MQDELNKRHEFARTLNEHGIYLMQQGISNFVHDENNMIHNRLMDGQFESVMNRLTADFRRVSTLIYLERYRDMGHGRCNICLKDFKP